MRQNDFRMEDSSGFGKFSASAMQLYAISLQMSSTIVLKGRVIGFHTSTGR